MEKNFETQINRLKELSEYIYLIPSDEKTYGDAVKTLGGNLPTELDEWLKLYNGGQLFGTSLYSTYSKLDGRFSRLMTFEEMNSLEFKSEINLDENLFCFAETNYGNYYCFQSGSQEIYEWDTERQGVTISWDSFSSWLQELIDTAEKDIADGFLEKLG